MFVIQSFKTKKEIIADMDDAIQRAKDLDVEFQPVFGVQVTDEYGELVFNTERLYQWV